MLYQARQVRHKVYRRCTAGDRVPGANQYQYQYSASVRGGGWAAMEVGAERLRPLSRDVSWQQGGRPRQASLRVARRRSSDEDVVRRPASNRNGYPLAFRPRPDPGQSVGGAQYQLRGGIGGSGQRPRRVCAGLASVTAACGVCAQARAVNHGPAPGGRQVSQLSASRCPLKKTHLPKPAK